MFECLWPPLDYLIIDLPPGTGDIQLTLVQTVPVTGAVLVTTPQQVAVADAVKAMNMFRMENINVPILGVVENMAWFTPAELPDNRYYLFGEGGGDKLAKAGETNVLARIPLVQSVGKGGDQGTPAILSDGPIQAMLSEMAKAVVKSVEERNAQFGPTEVVRMQ
jgi:ATP-binding protein involved in chromosome partitioning